MFGKKFSTMYSNIHSFALGAGLAMCGGALAQVMGSYPYPSFVAGTTAVGEQVTANFDAIKTAINAYDTTIRAYIDSSVAAGIPSGAVIAFNGACPTGFHELNGADGYADARGRFVRGLNDSGGAIDAGRALASLQDDALRSHTHTYTSPATAPGAAPGFSLGSAGATTGATGGTETRPYNIAFRLCQKA